MSLSGDADRFTTVQLTDCSLHGLGMNLPESYEAGQQFVLRLKLDKVVLLVYTLKYCIPTKTNSFRAGARFTGYHANTFRDDLQSVVESLTV
jgi:hypothetical protein